MDTIQTDLTDHPVYLYRASLESKASKEAMDTALRRALAVAMGENIRDVSMEDVFRFGWPKVTFKEYVNLKNALLKKYSKATTAQTLSAVRGVIGRCFDLGMIGGDQLMRIEREKKVNPKKGVGRLVEGWEIERLKDVVSKDDTPRGKRDMAILAWMFFQGPRVSEVVGAELKDYHRRTGKIMIRDSKGDDRENVLANGAKKYMDAWLACRGTWDGPLFTRVDPEGNIVKQRDHLSRWAITKMLEKRQEQAEINPFTPHDARRTFLTVFIDEEGIRKAQKIAGHKNVSTTQLYDRSNQDAALEASAKRDF